MDENDYMALSTVRFLASSLATMMLQTRLAAREQVPVYIGAACLHWGFVLVQLHCFAPSLRQASVLR